MDYKELVIQQLKESLAYNQASTDHLKTIASQKGFIYVIVDQNGRIHATRKSYGSANRAIEKGSFSSFAKAMSDSSELRRAYQVVTLNISQIAGKIEEKSLDTSTLKDV